MRRTAFFLALSCAATVVRAAVPALMPLPAKMDLAAGSLPIDATFGVAPDADARLAPAVKRFLARVAQQTGIFLSHSRSSATLAIACAPCTASPVLGEDESYQWDVTPAGATLKAATMAGALHGMETFLQLIEPRPAC